MGDTYRTFYSDPFIREDIGLITGSATVSRFPNLPGSLFRLSARSSNIGSFFIGIRSGTNQQPFEIDAGVDTGWFNLAGNNLNTLFFKNASGSSEAMAYWLQI